MINLSQKPRNLAFLEVLPGLSSYGQEASSLNQDANGDLAKERCQTFRETRFAVGRFRQSTGNGPVHPTAICKNLPIVIKSSATY